MLTPTYTHELKLLKDYQYIAGIDEVGRGPLAGPVVAAVVILNPAKVGRYRSKTKWWAGVRDSKTLSPRKRGTLVDFIKENSYDFGIGQATHAEIDELNIHYASLLAMRRAVENLKLSPEILLIDGRFKPFGAGPGTIAQQAIIDGDVNVLSIAKFSAIFSVLSYIVWAVLFAAITLLTSSYSRSHFFDSGMDFGDVTIIALFSGLVFVAVMSFGAGALVAWLYNVIAGLIELTEQDDESEDRSTNEPTNAT